MTNVFIVILDYINLIALLTAVVSCLGILQFLYERGIERSRFYSFNPLGFLTYIEITKRETGKCGPWAKILIISSIITIITAVALFLF